MSKYLVEDSVKLRLNHFPKKLLYRLTPGSYVMMFGLSPVVIDYEVKKISGERMVVIEYRKKDRAVRQWIKLDSENIRFGERPYFLCDCGYRANILYLRPGRDKFACRSCHGLVYELTTLNKNAYHNKIFYLNNRLISLKEKMLMSRISYRGKKTKRVIRFENHLHMWLANNRVTDTIGSLNQGNPT